MTGSSSEARPLAPATYRLWVSDDRCTLVRVWSNGACEVARRTDPGYTWEPPLLLAEEQVLPEKSSLCEFRRHLSLEISSARCRGEFRIRGEAMTHRCEKRPRHSGPCGEFTVAALILEVRSRAERIDKLGSSHSNIARALARDAVALADWVDQNA